MVMLCCDCRQGAWCGRLVDALAVVVPPAAIGLRMIGSTTVVLLSATDL
jgi:hypothetical protein